MEKRWCTACGQVFDPRPQSPRQAYCARVECQLARKRLWQQAKRKTDYGYYENQLEAQGRWRRKNTDYWRQYREEHPVYVATNREQQSDRNSRRAQKSALIAKSDASSDIFPASGVYRLVELQANQRGKIREWFVQLTLMA